MKKVLSVLAAAALISSFTGVSVSAHCRRDRSESSVYCGKYCEFTDCDEDGLCDSCGKKCRFTDKDDDGVCDVCGKDHCPEDKDSNNCGGSHHKGHHCH